MVDKCDQCGAKFDYDEQAYKGFTSLIISHIGKVTWEFVMCKKCSIEALKYFSDWPIGEVTPEGYKHGN